ncbi:GntR family transcriptional regulator [Halalkalibacter akibai]|uniref:Transcriptional regulator n=1 Tax=Halalkalibacter akibai (strain ATCC 43226 / DSM 21942 / CIP 109018 / JCM 9157 / 1139) TaxID=1236973 RepID=W4QPE9_HALA3|nr:GntR family transcriptional regulator [Halalkalibacter akibai]GAE33975.1 transcriptional regulator [Halalkalibacter akibai JCM 9157]
MANLSTRVNGSTREYVYNIIRDQIVNWKLEPGLKISEKEVAQSLNVSRTPVREAFLQLAQEELVGIYPQSGTIILKIDLDHVKEARFVREKIERAVVVELCNGMNEDTIFQLETNLTMQKLCLEKGTHQRMFELDEEFHRILFEGVNMKRTWIYLRQMNSHFDRLRVLRIASNTDWEVVVSQHEEIYKCISEKNAVAADKAIEKHLNLVVFETAELKERYPDYFK